MNAGLGSPKIVDSCMKVNAFRRTFTINTNTCEPYSVRRALCQVSEVIRSHFGREFDSFYRRFDAFNVRLILQSEFDNIINCNWVRPANSSSVPLNRHQLYEFRWIDQSFENCLNWRRSQMSSGDCNRCAVFSLKKFKYIRVFLSYPWLQGQKWYTGPIRADFEVGCFFPRALIHWLQVNIDELRSVRLGHSPQKLTRVISKIPHAKVPVRLCNSGCWLLIFIRYFEIVYLYKNLP